MLIDKTQKVENEGYILLNYIATIYNHKQSPGPLIKKKYIIE